MGEQAKAEGTQVGKVMRYFGKVGVAAVVASGEFSVGDTLHFKGHTTDFEMVVESMQVNDVSVQKAAAGDEVGIKVPQRVRERDIVYRK